MIKVCHIFTYFIIRCVVANDISKYEFIYTINNGYLTNQNLCSNSVVLKSFMPLK